MAFPPRPFNLRCRICDWTIHCRPTSDCFKPNEIPTRCKRCGSAYLEVEHGRQLRLKAFLRTHFGLWWPNDSRQRKSFICRVLSRPVNLLKLERTCKVSNSVCLRPNDLLAFRESRFCSRSAAYVTTLFNLHWLCQQSLGQYDSKYRRVENSSVY